MHHRREPEALTYQGPGEARAPDPPLHVGPADVAGLVRLDPGMRAAMLRGHGNAHVQRLARQAVLAREPAPAAAPATTGVTDAEGNAVDTTGKPHLTAVPAAVTWHRGVPEALPPNPLATYARLRNECVAIAQVQAANAAALRGDMKYWFARVYSFVTLFELQQIDRGVYEYPLAKLQQVIAFHATYERNLRNWKAGAKSLVEPNWIAAFGAAEAMNAGSLWQSKAMEIMAALLPSMQAHIRFDLPRAIASVYEREYAGIPGLSLGLFERDYNAMETVFALSSAAVGPEIEAACYGVDPGAFPTVRAVGFPFIFSLPVERRLTWDKAAVIVRAHLDGTLTQPEVQKRLKGEIIGSFPVAGPDTFEVADIEVHRYDWTANP